MFGLFSAELKCIVEAMSFQNNSKHEKANDHCIMYQHNISVEGCQAIHIGYFRAVFMQLPRQRSWTSEPIRGEWYLVFGKVLLDSPGQGAVN